MKEKADVIRAALKKNQILVLFTNCSVKYSGRAESFLPDGDRLIIIKEDKTVLVHQPVGNNPINYMKPGTDIDVYDKGKKAKLKCYNLPLKEYLTIELNNIHSLITEKLEDGKKLELTGTEKDMADMIFSKPSLVSRGFKPLSREEHTKYGFIDVFGYEGKTLTVVECKRYCGDFKAVEQLGRYVEKIKATKGVKRVKGVLACPKITPNAKTMLEDSGFRFVKVEPPKYLEKFNKNQKGLDDF